MEALLEYGPRYSSALGRAKRGLTLPRKVSDLRVEERLEGNATTDFGAPGAISRWDQRAVDDAEAKRLAGIIKACWERFDQVADAAAGRSLRKGPRGGGRSLDKMRGHVVEAEAGYLSALGGKLGDMKDAETRSAQVHRGLLEAVSGRIAGQIPSTGARGGERWPPSYAVRRAAWHVLDHAWELEDRLEG